VTATKHVTLWCDVVGCSEWALFDSLSEWVADARRSACRVEGMRCVLVEREAAYLPLIAQRLAQRLARPTQSGLF
jgi:hypothetical protein